MKKLPELHNHWVPANNRRKINEIVNHINNQLPHILIDEQLVWAKMKDNICYPNDFYPVNSIKKTKSGRLYVTWCNNRSCCMPSNYFMFKYIDLKDGFFTNKANGESL